jgi:general secretion pathway protein A
MATAALPGPTPGPKPGSEEAASLETYVEYYGLVEPPFSLTPNPRFIYQSRSHTAALEEVTRAINRREGLIVITGEIGIGKTTLCRILLQHLKARTFLSVVLSPVLSADDLLKQVFVDFGVISGETGSPVGHDPSGQARPLPSSHELVRTLHRYLATLIPLNAHAVIMIDEAQHLDPPVLEQIRLLSNFETDTAKLLQIVLVGQPDLDALLKRPDMRQLDQRVSRRCHLEPLTSDEVGQYVERRLWVAHGGPDALKGSQTGGEPFEVEFWRVRFTPAALRMVAAISGGIPRVINLLCDRALEIGYERRTDTIEPAVVLAAARRLALPVAFRQRVPELTPVRAAAAAAVIAAAAIAFGGWPLVRFTRGLRQAPGVAQVSARQRPSGNPRPVNPLPAIPAPANPPSANPLLATGGEAARTGRLESVDSFVLAVASFKSLQRASRVVDEVAGQGLPAFSRFDESSGWHVVLVGPFVSRAEATLAQQQLAPLGLSDPRILLQHP